MGIKSLLRLHAMTGGEPETVEATATGNPATFTTDIAKPFKALSVSFLPVLAGTGDPAPDNVRTISGISSVTVGVSDGEGTPVDYVTALGGTYYGGSLDVLTGVLSVEWELKEGTWGDIRTGSPDGTTGYYSGTLAFTNTVKQCTNPDVYGADVVCNLLSAIIWNGASRTPEHFYIYNSKAYISGNFDAEQVVQIAAKLAEPLTVQLTGKQVTDLLGNNSVTADTNGTVSVTYLKLK